MWTSWTCQKIFALRNGDADRAIAGMCMGTGVSGSDDTVII